LRSLVTICVAPLMATEWPGLALPRPPDTLGARLAAMVQAVWPPDGGRVEAAVPQAGDIGQAHGLVTAVDLDHGGGPAGGAASRAGVPSRSPLRRGRPRRTGLHCGDGRTRLPRRGS
jgi:hypothetical protein